MLAPECIEEGKYDFDQAYRATHKLLKSRPDAILVANDLMAIACMKALGDRRIAVPGDVAVIGYGDTILCKMATPALSSINQDAYELGFQGGELLLQKIKTKVISYATVLLPTRFIPPAVLLKRGRIPSRFFRPLVFPFVLVRRILPKCPFLPVPPGPPTTAGRGRSIPGFYPPSRGVYPDPHAFAPGPNFPHCVNSLFLP